MENDNKTTHFFFETKCPKCGKRLDAAVGPSDRPNKDDYTICVGCLSILQFNEDLTMRIAKDSPYEVEQARDNFRRFKHSLN